MMSSDWLTHANQGLKELADCSYATMRHIHFPPYRSLQFGGAGIAYTFWKAGCVSESPQWLHQARLWIDQVLDSPEDDEVARLPEHEGGAFNTNVKDSLYYGNRGVSFVHALIGYSEEHPFLYDKAIRELTAPTTKPMEMQELLTGIAGRLIGCSLLYRETGDADLRAPGEALARELLGTAITSSDQGILWGNNHNLGMAHGRAGNYYALMRWAKDVGYVLPGTIADGLRDYARRANKQDVGLSWPADERRPNDYMNSWCNGAPGLIHLFCLGYELYHDPLFLETAIAAGDYIVHQKNHRHGHLCCGASGVAYALLALNRVNPDGPWLDHARHQAEVAWSGVMVHQWRLSLYNGLAGVVCLMLDMNNPDEAAQPILEG